MNEKNDENDLLHYHSVIEKYFISKQRMIEEYRNIPLEEIIKNAPKYYSFIHFIESVHNFFFANKNWLKSTILKLGFTFDFKQYERWKASIKNFQDTYTISACPSLWIFVFQDYWISLLSGIQRLLPLEFLITDDLFRDFLKQNPAVKLKYMSQKKIQLTNNLDIIMQMLDLLLQLNLKYNFTINKTIDINVCLEFYRNLEKTKIISEFAHKSNWIKSRVWYLDRKSVV